MPTISETFAGLENGASFTVDVPSGVEIVSAQVKYKGGEKKDVDYDSFDKSTTGSSTYVNADFPFSPSDVPSGRTFAYCVAEAITRANNGTSSYLGASYKKSYSYDVSGDDFQASGSRSSNTFDVDLYRNDVLQGSDTYTNGIYSGGGYLEVELEFSIYWYIFLLNPSLQVNGHSGIDYNGTITNTETRNIDIPLSYIHEGTNNFVFSASEGESEVTIEIEYTHTPTKPTLTSPNGGENINENFMIDFEPSTDVDGDALTYQVQLSTDNGGGWHDILTGITGPTNYNFVNEEATSTALVRIRADDGSVYSNWDVSDGVFTIQHNVAPETPTGLTPSGGTPIDRASVARLGWTHQDPNSNDPQSQADVQWRPKGTTTWNDHAVTSPSQFWDAPENTFPYGDIEWRVRTRDQEGLVGPYSNIATFFAGNKPPTPTIVTDSSIEEANPTVQWSSSDQVTSRVRVLEDGTEVYAYTGGTNKAHTIQYDLENGHDYTIEVYVTNEDGLESDAAVLDIHVSYTPPALPVVELITDNASAQAVVTIEHPDPEGTQPDVIYCDIYRREKDGQWLRLFTELPVGEDYVDATLASGIEYEFYVRGWGENGTYADSVIVRGALQLKSIWLQDPDDDESLHHFRYYEPQRQANLTIGGSTRQFEGRPYPVADFNGRKQQNVSPVLQLMGNDLNHLQDLVNRQKTLLYRDNRGRRIFCVIFGVPETDEFWGSTVPIEVIAVDYKEGM